MSEIGSYEISTFSTGVKAETKRLNAQIDLFWPKESALYRRWGFVDNMNIVDIGCGTGYLIEKLLNEFPLSRFTGIEQDPHLATTAREGLEKYQAVEEIFWGPIEMFTPREVKFDIATMRLVLEHVPDPVGTLRHIRTLLKPGGKIIIIDNDFDYHLHTYPNISELDQLYKAYCASRIKDKGDPCIGRRLPALLKTAGYSNIDFELLSSHNHLIGDSVFLTAEGAGIPAQLVKSGFLDEQVMNALVSKWRNMLYSSDHIMFRQLFASTGTALANNNIESDILRSSTKTINLKTEQYAGNPIDYIKYIKTFLSNSLNISIDSIDENQSLINIGLDSIGASDMQQNIQQLYGVEITMSNLLGGSNTREIAEMMKNRIASLSSSIANTLKVISLPEDECGVV